MVKLIQGDCIEEMKKMDDNSVDCVICDPPYGLGFMGKGWDTFNPEFINNKMKKDKRSHIGIASQRRSNTAGTYNYKRNNEFQLWCEKWAVEVLRILKPGGFLLSFGGTRTYHRMVCGIEDAGFEIRDMIAWIYGSGFPKSLNIGKAVDKLQGDERKVVGKKIDISSGKPMSSKQARAGNGININEGWDRPWRKDKKHCEDMTLLTKGTSEWEGWGTALKPAIEPICIARKPLSEKTVAKNVLKWGTGGINVDGGRVEHNEDLSIKRDRHKLDTNNQGWGFKAVNRDKGRFPANVILDEEAAEMLDEQSGELISKWGKQTTTCIAPYYPNVEDKNITKKIIPQDFKYSNSNRGGASRFMKNIKVDLNDFLMYNVCRIIELRRIICGYTLENQKIVGMLNGVIQEVEKYFQNVGQFISGNSEMETFRKDMKPIILTLIKQMIELKISNACFAESIDYFTGESEKIIKLLMELNTEDVKNVKNIKPLIIFGNELLELLEDIVKVVQEQNLKSGKRKIENILMPICENTTKNIRFKYTAKASKDERNMGCEGLELGEPPASARSKPAEGRENALGNPRANSHPTVKPIALMKYLVKLFSKKGAIVLDPFMGSGTTGIACKELGRDFIGIEKEPEYFRIAQNRIKAAQKPLIVI